MPTIQAMLAETKIDKKPHDSNARRLQNVNLDRLQHQFLTVLKREASRLLDISYTEKLSADASKTLVNYIKLLGELKELELKDLENLTDEELEKLTKKGVKHV